MELSAWTQRWREVCLAREQTWNLIWSTLVVCNWWAGHFLRWLYTWKFGVQSPTPTGHSSPITRVNPQGAGQFFNLSSLSLSSHHSPRQPDFCFNTFLSRWHRWRSPSLLLLLLRNRRITVGGGHLGWGKFYAHLWNGRIFFFSFFVISPLKIEWVVSRIIFLTCWEYNLFKCIYSILRWRPVVSTFQKENDSKFDIVISRPISDDFSFPQQQKEVIHQQHNSGQEMRTMW